MLELTFFYKTVSGFALIRNKSFRKRLKNTGLNNKKLAIQRNRIPLRKIKVTSWLILNGLAKIIIQTNE
jgi:hypothetical protein